MEKCLEDLLMKASILIDKGDYKKAEKILKALLFLDNKDHYTNFEYARLLLEKPKRKKELINVLLFLYCEYNDINATLELGKIEFNDGNLKNARMYFESALKLCENPVALQYLIYINIHEEKYKEAYKLYKKFIKYDYKECHDSVNMGITLHNKLNLPISKHLKKSYFYQQLTDYNEDKAIEHIKCHLEKKDHSVYSNIVNVDALYRDSIIKIQNINPNTFMVVDKYVLDYNYIVGTSRNKITNRVEVVTIPNTKDILTIYPKVNSKLKAKVINNNNFLR